MGSEREYLITGSGLRRPTVRLPGTIEAYGQRAEPGAGRTARGRQWLGRKRRSAYVVKMTVGRVGRTFLYRTSVPPNRHGPDKDLSDPTVRPVRPIGESRADGLDKVPSDPTVRTVRAVAAPWTLEGQSASSSSPPISAPSSSGSALGTTNR